MEFHLAVSLILLLLLLYYSAWISSAETALFSLPSHKIRVFKQDTNKVKQLIAKLLAHPRDLLVTVFMVNTFINIMLQNVASDMFGNSGSWVLKVGVPLILTLIFGEIIPKYLGLQNNQAIALKVAKNIERLQNLLSPIRSFIIQVTAPISRLLFFFLRKENTITKAEIEHVLKTSESHGVLNRDEAELLAGYLNLQEALVKELMQPKEDILYYDLSEPVSRLEELFTKEECSRVPVCKESLENVLGLLSSVSYFKEKGKKEIPSLLSKPSFFPETMPAKALLRKMNEQHLKAALIVDEYGSITGYISREDLIEVVIGQIEDPLSSQQLYIKAGSKEVIASGKWDLSEFNDHFHADLQSQTGMVSIGGWLTEMHGDLPKSGEKINLAGFLFHVLSAGPTRITRLFIKKVE